MKSALNVVDTDAGNFARAQELRAYRVLRRFWGVFVWTEGPNGEKKLRFQLKSTCSMERQLFEMLRKPQLQPQQSSPV